MIVKVCGMRDLENISALQALDVQYMGMIFYEKSSRFVSEEISPNTNAQKVGVFVNTDFGFIQKKIKTYGLKAVQLHGDESPEFCTKLKEISSEIKIFKAFRVDKNLTTQRIKSYEGIVDLFILDSGGKLYGGNGVKWDYSLLNNLELNTPFLLSGGIDDDIPKAELVSIHEQCVGVDLNRKFEIAPGLKDIQKLKEFLKRV